jgi:hypothetical protein
MMIDIVVLCVGSSSSSESCLTIEKGFVSDYTLRFLILYYVYCVMGVVLLLDRP